MGNQWLLSHPTILMAGSSDPFRALRKHFEYRLFKFSIFGHRRHHALSKAGIQEALRGLDQAADLGDQLMIAWKCSARTRAAQSPPTPAPTTTSVLPMRQTWRAIAPGGFCRRPRKCRDSVE